MIKQKKLEKIICGLNENNLPKHAIKILEANIDDNMPTYYCFDSRREECDYCLTYQKKSYCNYLRELKKNK